MAHLYKEVRTCECGYSTLNRGAWSTHGKSCRMRIDPEKEALRQQVEALRQQLDAAMQRIQHFEQVVMNLSVAAGEHTSKLNLLARVLQQEVKEVRKRKDRYTHQAAARCHLTEPQRRVIAIRQGWKCNVCRCDLAEYDVDHMTPLWKGGPDEDANRQAVCVACHRQKTDRERIERSTGEAPAEPAAGPGVVG